MQQMYDNNNARFLLDHNVEDFRIYRQYVE